ncbi:MAG: carboxypeptidase-like regulatory domain-containing protein [Candidatus Eremiobacteraeota bacterium]|nr:carboxypeptidase-like regulatory domain-containing protein [Candidatus Eremiobacteraeota bacterium]
MRGLVAAVSVAAAIMSAAVGAAAAPAHTTAAIGGKVVDSIDQRPLGGVQVDVFDDSLRSHVRKAVATTTTNKDGSFSLLGLRGGNYHLELVKRGYALEIITGLLLRPDERVLIAQPFGMRTAIVTRVIGQAMETRL